MNISQNEIAIKNKNSFGNMPDLEDKIVFLGNSITAQGEWAELFGRGDIANRGIPGDVIDGVNERLKEVLEENPAQVFIMIGINDLLQGRTFEDCKRSYLKMFEICDSKKETEIYIQSILPINNEILYNKKIDNKKIRELNEFIKEVCQKNGTKFIDLVPVFTDKENGNLIVEYTVDGLHLKNKAYQIWTEFLSDYLKL